MIVSSTKPPRTADVVIIGAGVMGASVAFHLAMRKAGRIVVVEKDHVGAGSSGRSSAVVRMHYTFRGEVQLALRSLEIFQNWEEIVGEASDFRKTGFVRIVPPSDTERLKRNVAMQQSEGVNVRLVRGDELKELEPDWFVDDIETAAYEPDSGYADGANVASGFLSRARDLGATYLPRTSVQRILSNGSCVSGVATSEGEIHARTVILGAGNLNNALLQPLGISLPIEMEYHEVAILKNPPTMKSHASACLDGTTATYFRSDGGDKTLVGDRCGERPADPENFPQRPSQESLAEIWEMACHRSPRLKDAELMRGITGVYDMSPDGRPILGTWPGQTGLYLMAGFSGTGFKLSPAIGLTMTELILDGKSRTVDLAPFRPTRFAEGQLIHAPDEYTSGPLVSRIRHRSAVNGSICR